MSRPPLPPFTAETAAQKARMAEDAWNSRDPARVALAYTTLHHPTPRTAAGETARNSCKAATPFRHF